MPAPTPVEKLIGDRQFQKDEYSTSVALQAWTNDKFVAMQALFDSQVADVKELFYRLTSDHEKSREQFYALSEKAQEQQFTASREAVTAALAAAEKAVTKSESDNNKWRANANEWRGAMLDREKMFVLKGEYDAFKSHVEQAMMIERSRSDRGEGKGQGFQQMWAVLVGVVAMIIAAAGVIISTR